MSSPTSSDISQHDAEILEEQCHEIQQQHKEEQQSLLHLQEIAEAYYIGHMAQKARREVETKAKEEAKKWRIAEKKKKKLEYIQQLWDKVIVENTILLEGSEGSQVVGSKHKKVTSRDEKRHWPSKKAKEKYHRDNAVKMGRY